MKKFIFFLTLLTLLSCSTKPISKKIYSESDDLASLISLNISQNPNLSKVLEVDHSRLANLEGENLLPTRLIMFSNKTLEEKLINKNILLTLEIPFKILVYTLDGKTNVLWNDLNYISKRYNLDFSEEIKNEYEASFLDITKDLDNTKNIIFNSRSSTENNIITLKSPYNYEKTYQKSMEFIKENKDVIIFDTLTFNSKMAPKISLIIYGAPKPGGKVMKKSQSLGLDGFPQKLLIWEDSSQNVHIAYNNLLKIADNQGIKKSIAMRIIQYRLNNLFPKEFSRDE